MTRARTTGLAGTALLAALVIGGVMWMRGPAGDGDEAFAQQRTSASRAAPAVDPWAAPAQVTRPSLRYDRFETITTADGLPSNKVTCVLAEDGVLWVGTDAGLAVREDDVWTIHGPESGLAHQYVTSVSRDVQRGGVWVSTLAGLNHLSGGGIRTYTQLNSGLANDVVYHVMVDGDLVWAATAAGASCLDTRSGSWAVHDHENSIMHEPWCYALASGPGRTWIGVWGGGIVELDRTTQRWREYRDPDREMEIDLLRDDGPIHDVTAFVAYDQGVLWQATYFGLARFDGRRWQSYTAQDTGLPGDFLSHIASIGHTVWLASDQGLGVFDGSECVAYLRQGDGTCAVTVWRDGSEIERSTLPTAPADNYLLWAQGGESDVWIATGSGLSHGTAGAR